MSLPFNAAQVQNITINSSSQPGLLYVLNGGLYAFDISGNPTVVAGQPILPGTVVISAATVTPLGYLKCNGSDYQQADYPNLYAAISTTFGNSTITSFKVPNLTALATGVNYIIKT